MNSVEIRRELSRSGKLPAKAFRGVLASDRLPSFIRKFPAFYVINLDPAHLPGSHWVAVYMMSPKRCEYFDSYGLPPLVENIERFIFRNSGKCHFNRQRIQGDFSFVCGHYCIAFIKNRARKRSMKYFISKFSKSDLRKNDNYIKYAFNK